MRDQQQGYPMKAGLLSLFLAAGMVCLSAADASSQPTPGGKRVEPNDPSLLKQVVRPGAPKAVPAGIPFADVALRLGDYEYAAAIYQNLLPHMSPMMVYDIHEELELIQKIALCFESIQPRSRSTLAKAYMWLFIGHALGKVQKSLENQDRAASMLKSMQSIRKELTDQEAKLMQEKARICWASNYKDCE